MRIGEKPDDRIQKQLIGLLAADYSASRGWKAAPTVLKTRHHGTTRGRGETERRRLEVKGHTSEDGIEKQQIHLLVMDSVDLPCVAAAARQHARHASKASRAGKAVPTVTPKTVAYSNILIYDLLSGKRIAVIRPIGCALEGLESI